MEDAASLSVGQGFGFCVENLHDFVFGNVKVGRVFGIFFEGAGFAAGNFFGWVGGAEGGFDDEFGGWG